MADRSADRVSQVRCAHQGRLLRRPLRAAPRTPRRSQAIGATRHDILVACYYIVRDQVPFRELGPDWLRRRYSPEHRARRLAQQLEALGYKVTFEQASPAEQEASAAA